MEIYIMDFGIIVKKDNKYSFVRYFENRRIFSLVSKSKNIKTKLYQLDYNKILVDKSSSKKIKYWLNKFNHIQPNVINQPNQIEYLLNKLPKKYNKFIYTND